MKNIFTLITCLSIILFTLMLATVGYTNPELPLTDDILRSKAAFAVVDEKIAHHLNLSVLSEWDYQKLRGPVLWKIRAPIHSYLRKAFGKIVDSADFGGSADSFSQSQTLPMKPVLHKRAAEIIRDFINQEHISVIIRSNAPIGIGEVAAIRGLRGEVRYTYDSINGACVFVPIRNLTALIKRPFVREVWLDSKGRAALKDSVRQIGADQVHNLPVAGSGVMGEGVYVAVVDSGIDPLHPEFQGRILDNRKVTINSDHGTHVAGIIGSADGVAPKVKFLDARMSGITLLRFDDSFFNSNSNVYSDTLDAIKWAAHKKLFLNAEEKADVINMSWGWPIWIYGRNGDDPMSEWIDEVVSDGVVFVVSAGNNAYKRATGAMAPNAKPSPHTFTVYHKDNTGAVFPSITVTCVLLWDRKDNDLDLAILDSNDDEVAESRSNPFFFLGKTYKEDTEDGIKKFYELVELTSESPNGVEQVYTLQVEGADVQVDQEYEVWVGSDHAVFERPNSEKTISVPGYSEKAITVGAVDNSKQIVYFSSQGPSDADLIKPEIVAPGESIESTIRGGGYEEMDGTSMAAPHIAGVAALILDAVGKNGRGEWNFSPDEVKSAIVHGAEELFNKPNTYGAGLVRADNVIFGNTVEANQKRCFKIEPQPTGLNVDFALKVAISWESPTHNLDMVLLDANGRKVLESNQVSSNYEKMGPPPNQGATYFLEVHNRSGVRVSFTGAATHKIIEATTPDLIVKTPTPNKSTLAPGDDFTLSTSIENQGDGQSAAATLHYYKWDSTDKEWKRIPDKTSDVEPLSANDTTEKYISLTAPNSAGIHHYTVCVSKVTDENDTSNNCAKYLTITVEAVEEIVPLPPSIFWTDFGEIDGGTARIQWANLDGTNIENLVTDGLLNPSSIALDIADGKMYWTDHRAARIQRANLDGTNIENLVTRGLRRPIRIALDVAGGKMYWTDAWSPGKIQRANLDGTNIENLITFTGDLSSPFGIALDVAGGKMYWTDSRLAKIQRANLDGSNVEDLVTRGVDFPAGIALDVASGKMYWTTVSPAKIQRANLDGSNVEDLVAGGQPNDITLDVANGKMYWTTINPAKIQRADLDGRNIEDLVTSRLTRPYGITLSIPSQSPSLVGTEDVNGDGISPRDIVPHPTVPTETVYWTDWETNKIQRARVNGTHVEDLVTTGLISPYSIVLDVDDDKMYWTDAGTAKIQRANLDGSNVEDLIPLGLSAPICIALDVTGDKMYWTDRGTGKIQCANLDGSNVEDLVFGVRGLHGIALDVAAGKMYWTDNEVSQIQRANLDGTRVENLITTRLQFPNEIALDVVGGKMYWTDDGTRKIQRANLDGSNVEDLITTGLHLPVGITLDIAGGKLYWTDIGTKKIQCANLDGSNVQDLITTGLKAPFGITLGPSSTLAPRVVAREDVNGDGVVDLLDLVLVTQNNLDINGDGVSDIADRLLVIEAMVNAGGAPAAQGGMQQLFTAEKIQQWLIEATLLGEDSHVYEKAILVLKQLLARLIPQETALLPNYPNPLNPETWIPYQIAEPTDVTLHIYAANGHLVRTLVLGHQQAGIYQNRSRAAYWDGKNALGEPVASGVYFYTLTAGDFTATRKMLIQK